MSLKETIIDAASAQTLTFIDRTFTNDTEGNPTPVDTTIAEVVGDLQPAMDVSLKESPSGSVARTGGEATATHVMFPRTRVAGVTEKMILVDENSVEYTIVFIHDFRGAPQEFDLRQN